MRARLGIAAEAPPDLSPRRLAALFALLGFSAGLPLYMFSAVLTLRLARHGVDVAIIGFFAWVGLVPTVKFLWAPLLDRWAVPGFARAWGRRRSWIMLAQLGIAAALVGMALTADDASLPLTALFAVCLAFWTTTLEIAADGWRIALAPTQGEQAPLVTANLWGYRSAMVAAGSGAVWLAARADWTTAYLAIAAAAFAPFPVLVAMRASGGAAAGTNRARAVLTGLVGSLGIIAATTALIAVLGRAVLEAAARAGIGADSSLTPIVLALCILPFALLAAFLPRIRRMEQADVARLSPWLAPYVEVFWRFGFGVLAVLGFVSLYRMGDVLALALNHPLWNALGYSLDSIAMADGAVSLLANLAGVGLGGWAAARWPLGRALLAGAVAAAASNWVYVWLWTMPVRAAALYLAVAVDQFGNGMAAAVFVVYLSGLVNPRFAAAQYAFLAGFAFLFARLLAGLSGTMQKAIGYDGFFWLAGGLSLAAVAFLPFVTRIRARG